MNKILLTSVLSFISFINLSAQIHMVELSEYSCFQNTGYVGEFTIKEIIQNGDIYTIIGENNKDIYSIYAKKSTDILENKQKIYTGKSYILYLVDYHDLYIHHLKINIGRVQFEGRAPTKNGWIDIPPHLPEKYNKRINDTHLFLALNLNGCYLSDTFIEW